MKEMVDTFGPEGAGGLDPSIMNEKDGKVSPTWLILQGMELLGKRMDSLEHGLNQLREDLNKRIDGLEQGLNKRMDGLDKRLDAMDKRMDGLDKRLDGLESVLAKRFDFLLGTLLVAILGLLAKLLIPGA